ncbi:hypothetical protein ALC57_16699 [Trachymyrmex cornetzi]|uniref:Uncharacterized protein n=1 Tax=Trachymyrmex cornetzi TaxID=471704 RepID=A0A195DE29_9HYME|nr:hypothetical protein ALC57_16699 [Trachymyrmex cornetzi]
MNVILYIFINYLIIFYIKIVKKLKHNFRFATILSNFNILTQMFKPPKIFRDFYVIFKVTHHRNTPFISLNISILSAEPARLNIFWHVVLLSSIVSFVGFTTASTCNIEISPVLKQFMEH